MSEAQVLTPAPAGSPGQDFQEPPQFAGLLYWDGIDAVGRPVIVVNADAVSEDKVARRAAADYILHLLEPIVIRVRPSCPSHVQPPHAMHLV